MESFLEQSFPNEKKHMTDESSGYDSYDSNVLNVKLSSTQNNQSGCSSGENYLVDLSLVDNKNVLTSETFEYPSMEYDESWEPKVNKATNLILMRELSYDNDFKDLKDVDLLAPVFLAVTNDDTEDKSRGKDVTSILDLCRSTLDIQELHKDGISKRSHLLKSLKKWYSQPLLCSSMEINDQRLNSILSNHSSCTDLSRKSVMSDLYNESIDDSLEDEAIMDVFRNNEMYKGEFDSYSESDIFLESDFTSSSLQDLNNVDPLTPLKKNELFECKNRSSKNSYSAELLRNINTSPESFASSPKKIFDRYITVKVCGEHRTVDTKLLDPYLKVLSHGGYKDCGIDRCVLLVFNAAHLPAISIPKYKIIMEQLFYYCVHALDLLVTDTYELVFFNSQMRNDLIPPIYFIKRFYEMLHYKFKKKLQNIYFVHQNIWLKTIIHIAQLLASSKFRKKIHIVRNLKELKKHVPMEYIYISPSIYRVDEKFQ